MSYYDQVDFASLTGKTLAAVYVSDNKEEVRFITTEDEVFWMGHHQDCCEHVYLEDVAGDIADIVGTPIVRAEVVEQNSTPDGYQHDYEPESQTWTFYKLDTIKGGVTLRWFGESNGYYSEGVDFERDTTRVIGPAKDTDDGD